MSTLTLSPEAAAYLGAVRAELSDLEPEERDDLLADVEVSLAESSAEGDGSLDDRFGPPARFAAELRAAAGLGVGPVRSMSAPGVFSRAGEWLRSAGVDERVLTARRVLAELAPIWWLARAYLAAAGAVVFGFGSWSTRHPELPSFGGRGSTVVIMTLLVVGSLALGIKQRRSPSRGPMRKAMLVLNVALAALTIPAWGHLASETARTTPDAYFASPEFAPGAEMTYNGIAVQNVYPFNRDGRPLYDVLLYDQNGRALAVGRSRSGDPNRRVVETARGTQLFNSFPIRYYEPGSKKVARPGAGPRLRAPRVVTPPLRLRAR
jgi:hypothetical protein